MLDFFFDMKNRIESYEIRFSNAPKKAAFRLAYWSLKYLINFEKKHQIKAQKKTENINEISVLYTLAGGYGDYLLFANYLSYFLEKFRNEPIKVYLGYHIKTALTIFNYPIEKVELLNAKSVNINPEEYDVAFHLCVFPKILNYDDKKVYKLSPMLKEYLDLCVTFYDENRMILDKHPALDGWGTARSIAKGIKRIQEPDVYGYLGINEKYKYKILIQEDEAKYLSSIGLKDSKYILIHRGWDGTSLSNVKAWSEKSCGDIIPRLKKTFPNYHIVLFGSDKNQAPKNLNGLDINLVGKTSLEQVKVLLKYASILIDNEGGMVHLRHAVGAKPSVVFFGPTSDKLFGYSENINLNAHVCGHFCEWLTNDWPLRCPRGEGVPCMEAISTNEVIDACKKIIQKDKD